MPIFYSIKYQRNKNYDLSEGNIQDAMLAGILFQSVYFE